MVGAEAARLLELALITRCDFELELPVVTPQTGGAR